MTDIDGGLKPGVDQLAVLQSLRQQAKQVRIDRATSELVAVLNDHGIRSILLKGPTTARILYAREDRWYNDIDLLVEPSELQRTEDIAIGLGFVARPKPGSRVSDWFWRATEAEERTYDRSSDAVTLDLHRSFHQLPVALDLLSELWPTRDQMLFSGVTVQVPGPASVGLLTLLHAATANHPRSPRDRQLADVMRAVERLGPEVWSQIADLSRQLRVDGDVVAVLVECGGPAGKTTSATHFPGIQPDRWTQTHLRTGSIIALQLRKLKTYNWRQRALWCLTPFFSNIRPTASLRSQSGTDGRRAVTWLLNDVRGVVRVLLCRNRN
jgi:hypothetical protein